MSATQETSALGRERRTDYVVLAVLQQGPATGYGVRKRIAESVGNFWQESFGQLYPALRALTANGLVRARSVSVGKRAAEEFSLTARGTRALRAWVRREPRVEPERNELLLKLFLINLDPLAVMRHVQATRAKAKLEKARLERMLLELSKDYAEERSLPAWCSTVDYGLTLQVAYITWCDRTLARLNVASKPNRAVRSKTPSQRAKGTTRASASSKR